MIGIVSDYRAWKSLGRVVYRFRDWLMVTRFSPAKRDPFGTDNDRIGGSEDSVQLVNLPTRQGPRPRIGVHPVPHRQLDQFAEENMRQQLERLFGSFVAANDTHVHFVKSFYEKRNDAVTLIDPNHSNALAKISHGEAAHIHLRDSALT